MKSFHLEEVNYKRFKVRNIESFFGNIKTIIVEIIGIIGGIIWAKNTNWDFEPLILIAGSGSSLLFSILLLILKNGRLEVNQKPELEIKKEQALRISDVTPELIEEEINNAPPYQKKDVANSFVGIEIEWPLRLFNIRENPASEGHYVAMSGEKGKGVVFFNTSVDKYPILKIAKKDSLFLVSGKITKCDYLTIDLDLYTLKKL